MYQLAILSQFLRNERRRNHVRNGNKKGMFLEIARGETGWTRETRGPLSSGSIRVVDLIQPGKAWPGTGIAAWQPASNTRSRARRRAYEIADPVSPCTGVAGAVPNMDQRVSRPI